MTETASWRQVTTFANLLRDDLAELAAERSSHQDWVLCADGEWQLEWVVKERQMMRKAVNQNRKDRGLPEVTMKVIMAAESLACGHVDYASKFAMYCAELAFGRSQWDKSEGS